MQFQPILNTIFSKCSGGACPRIPLEDLKKFFLTASWLKIFFQDRLPSKQKILDRTLITICYWPPSIISVWLKFSVGGQRWWHLQNPLPPTNNFCLYPPPVLRCFWKDPLMTPQPPTIPLQTPFTATPSPSSTPSPHPKNFGHTLSYFSYFGHIFYQI